MSSSSSYSVGELSELSELGLDVAVDDWRAAVRRRYGVDEPVRRPRPVRQRPPPPPPCCALDRPHDHEGLRRAIDPAYARALFALSPDVPHPMVPVQRLLPVLQRYRDEGGRTFLELARLGIPDAEVMSAILATICEAFMTPIAFRGGNDCARGYGAPGSEWPQLGALAARAPSRSDTTLRDWFRAWEEDGVGYRKTRLEREPIVCPKTGKVHPNRFGRNDVYLSRETLLRWTGHPATDHLCWWLRVHSVLLREIWVITKPGRAWRKRHHTYRDAIELTYTERHAKTLRQRSAIARRIARERKWRQAARVKAARDNSTKRTTGVQTSAATRAGVPIIPSLPTEGEPQAARAAEADGPRGPAPPRGPPAGRPVAPGPPRDAERSSLSRTTEIRAALEGEIAGAVPAPPTLAAPRAFDRVLASLEASGLLPDWMRRRRRS